ncbi:hypothetical protein Salat_1855900 [Sesamum alatum]|uniref:Uncharacterized protein n=1 Tax=Sesamum alatum TaxID=300844 RepID=A0AAE2CI13_9LAMI|nr:hypothetical protein Salat_1855900 [Sesamum alatum]
MAKQPQSFYLQEWLQRIIVIDSNMNGSVQCIALALARSDSVSYRSSLLVSLALGLLTEVFSLLCIYNKVLKFPDENRTAVLDEIKNHLSSVISKEAGARTGAFCNQYASSDECSRSTVENLIWDYCQEVYLWHREGKGDACWQPR